MLLCKYTAVHVYSVYRYLRNAQEGLDFLCPEGSSLANQQLAHSCGFDVTDTLVVYRTERLIQAAAKQTNGGSEQGKSVDQYPSQEYIV